MNPSYDKYYQTENLFGEAYPELLAFFKKHPQKGKVLDLGCGHGRDAIAIAKLGYAVTGIDNSKVGIDQMNHISQKHNLNLIGHVGDIYTYDKYEEFDFILIDSMFHFAKKDKEKEMGLIKKIIAEIKSNSLFVVCIQDSGKKVQTLNQAIDFNGKIERIEDKKFTYTFEDNESGHKSVSDYRMIITKK